MKHNVGLVISFIFLGLYTFAQSWVETVQDAKKAYANGNYELAYQQFLEAQKKAPEGINLSKDIGIAAYRNKAYTLAEKAFNAAAHSSLSNELRAEQWHNVGNSQLGAKNYKAAIESYKKALRLNPNNEGSRYNLAYSQKRLEQLQQSSNPPSSSSSSVENTPSDHFHSSQPSVASDTPSTEKVAPMGQLAEKRTDNILEELLKQEMKTRQRVERMLSNDEERNALNSRKRW